MATRYRMFWLITLGFFVTGCSGTYRPVLQVETAPGYEESAGDKEGPEPGDDLRLTLRDGRRIKGTLVEIRQEEMVLRRVRLEGSDEDTHHEIEVAETVLSEDEYGFPLSDIAQVEIHHSHLVGGLVVGVATIGCLVMMGWMLANPLGD